MKTKLFSIFLTFILCSTVFLPISIAQDYTTWDLPEGATKRLGKGWISEIAYSPDGSLLAVAGGIGIWLYDAETGEELNLFTGHTDYVYSVSFSLDGEMLASGSWDGTVRLWDVATGAAIRTLTGHTDRVNSVSFSPGGEMLASGSLDGTVRLWDVATGAAIRTLTGHTDRVYGVSFSPDGEMLASGSLDGTVLLWNLAPAAPEPTHLAADVNGDGVVNIQDLVTVASNFGATGENAADVNADGTVNIQDLVQVAGQFGAAAAAPSAWDRDRKVAPTKVEVEQWLIQAQALNLTDATSQRGIRFLAQLLLALIPKETALLPNYPNPFNPETWIPYQLSTPGDVTIEIHAIDGTLVRTLSLGHQPVGMYQSRSRAAYWNGRNQIGEPVASGVYFYTLTAGEFTATRKMLIHK